MPIDLESNSALGNQTYFYQNVEVVLRKATKLETWKSGLKFKKNICDRKTPDGEVVGPKFLYIEDLRIHGCSIGQD